MLTLNIEETESKKCILWYKKEKQAFKRELWENFYAGSLNFYCYLKNKDKIMVNIDSWSRLTRDNICCK